MQTFAPRRFEALFVLFVSFGTFACGTDSPAEGPIASTNADTGVADTAAPTDVATDAGPTGSDTLKPPDSGVSASSGGVVDGGASSGGGTDVGPVDGGTTDTGPACQVATDCPQGDSPCVVATCVGSSCGLANAPATTECDDGDLCTIGDLCKDGACLPGAVTACDDANACTIDACDKNAGCSHTNVSIACDDGNKCTTADQCKDGVCTAGAAAQCDDASPCTDDSCEALVGCIYTANTANCDDNNACTIDDACSGKACLPGAVTACDDNNGCTNDSCDAQNGCGHTANKLPCSDGNACTTSDSCANGVCKGGTKLDCDDNNTCTDDTCDADAGCKSAANTSSCDDGSLCTENDVCNAGKCESGTSKTCSDGNPCSTDGCDPTTGCTFKLHSGTCDDNNACTDFDLCGKGKCKGVAKDPKADCDDNNVCTTDSCDPGNATTKGKGCQHTNNTAACDDGNVCSKGDVCAEGSCKAGSNVCDCTEDKHCAPLNPKNPCLGTLFCDKSAAPFTCKLNPATVVKCSSAGDTVCATNRCDPADKKCKVTPASDGKPCDADGSVCTVGDACAKGKCAVGKSLQCNDANPCTNDACDPKSGCVNTANSAPCNADDNPCTVGDVCINKACQAGKPKSCDDGDKCTTDSCDKKTGSCKNAEIAGCGGNCQTDKHCDDNTTCTADKCVKQAGESWGKCSYGNQVGACTDFNSCTTSDHCQQGKCVGTAKVCNDGNPCTNDGCDPTKGCVHPPNAAPCDDFDKCTLADQCKDGKCAGGIKKPCDDNNKCTADSCNPGNGFCLHKGIAGCGGFCDTASDCDDGNPCTKATCVDDKCQSQTVSGACDDGDKCTPKDTCSGGNCKAGTPKNCDDKNSCTTDSCDKKTGTCVNAESKAGAACDDNSKCTTSDVCALASGKLVCAGKKKDCNDGNSCTDDVCDGKTGNCQPTLNTKPCEDGNKCTFGDTCANGKCVAGSGVIVDTLSGSGGIHGNKGGFANGAGDKALFSYPVGVTVNSKNVVYVADQASQRIRRVAADGTTTTFAGSGDTGLLDGKGEKAWFNRPYGLAIAADDAIYVADVFNHAIRRISSAGDVTTLAGTGQAGSNNGEAGKARFNRPHSLVVSKGGVVFVADAYNHRIRRIENGQVSTFAGTGKAGFANGAANVAQFYYPLDLAIAANGHVLVADQSNHRIRSIAPNGAVTTFAGSGTYGALNGNADKASFRNPWGIDVDSNGVVWVADRFNHRIRRIAGGVVSTYAGTGSASLTDGKANVARFFYPTQIAAGRNGTLYVADQYTHRVRRIRNSTNACAIGGNCWANGTTNPQNGCQSCLGTTSTSQWTTATNGTACNDNNACTTGDACSGGSCKASAKVCDDKDKCTLDVCDASTGLCTFKPIVGCGGNCTKSTDCDDKNACTDDICSDGKCANPANSKPCDDSNSCTVGDVCSGGKCVAGSSNVVSTIAGSGTAKHADGPAKTASFHHPRGVELAKDGTIWVADGHNHRIRQVAKDGTVTTVAGLGTAGMGDGPANQALFHYPTDVAVNASGQVVVADVSNHRVRLVDPGKKTVSTLAGANAAFADGSLEDARFYNPQGVAIGDKGAIYVADCSNHRVRVIEPAAAKVWTLAGSAAGFVNGKGSSARFSCPVGVAVDGTGTVYVSDYSNHAIRKVDRLGNVTTIGGNGKAGSTDGPASVSRFYHPWGIAVDSGGTVIVADRHNHRIRTIDANNNAVRIAGVSYGHADGDGLTKARFYYPLGLDVGPDGTVYVGGYSDQRIRKIFRSKGACAIGGTCYSDAIANPAQPCQACDGAKNGGAWTASSDGSACDDGNVCTTTDVCATGKCGGKATVCNDNDKCTKDACGVTGVCTFTPIVGCNGYCTKDSDCDDKNSCTVGEACVNNVCTKGTAVITSTIAGSAGTPAFLDGDADKAKFNRPYDVEVTAKGEVLVVDYYTHRIRMVAGGKVTTFAGAGVQGLKDGKAVESWFNNPSGLAAHKDGTIYVADRSNHAVRKISAQGVVSTLAGNGIAGYVNAKGSAARLNQPIGIDVSATGVVYVADYAGHRIRKIAADGTVSLLAGSGAGYADGKGDKAKFNGPIDVVVDASNNVFVAELGGHKIRKITPDSTVTTYAGTGQAGLLNGDAKIARFYQPWGLALDTAGRLYVGSFRYHRIRVISGGTVFPLTGSSAGLVDGPAGRFYHPVGIASDVHGALYVADWTNNRVRKVVPSAGSCTIDKACWADGVKNPANACQRCDGLTSASSWTAIKGCAP